MRIPKWLAVVFFASLALNLGVLAGYGYQTYLWAQGRRHARTYFQGWAPDAERRLSALMDQHLENRYRLDSLRVLVNRRLDELTYVEQPDSLEVERLLDQAAQLERELASFAYRTGRGIQALLPPEKRRQVEKAYRRLMGLNNADSIDASPTVRDSATRATGAKPKRGG